MIIFFFLTLIKSKLKFQIHLINLYHFKSFDFNNYFKFMIKRNFMQMINFIFKFNLKNKFPILLILQIINYLFNFN